MGRWLLRMLAFALAVGFIALVLCPIAIDQYRRYQDAQVIDRYLEALEAAEPEALETALERCRIYNRWHRDFALADPFTQTVRDYNEGQLLDEMQITGEEGIIGTLEIPKIGVSLPVYRSSDRDALRKGAAFIEGTSLPVGGESAHTALAAESDWLEGRQFRKLDRMRVGDLFAVRALGETFTYEVERVELVDPEALGPLERTDDAGYCTLMARGPKWNGSQRLLVRGKLTEDRLTAANDDTGYLPELAVVLILGAPLALIILVWMLLKGLAARAHERWRLRRLRL